VTKHFSGVTLDFHRRRATMQLPRSTNAQHQ
jgi:hypothetical protein